MWKEKKTETLILKRAKLMKISVYIGLVASSENWMQNLIVFKNEKLAVLSLCPNMADLYNEQDPCFFLSLVQLKNEQKTNTNKLAHSIIMNDPLNPSVSRAF